MSPIIETVAADWPVRHFTGLSPAEVVGLRTPRLPHESVHLRFHAPCEILIMFVWD